MAVPETEWDETERGWMLGLSEYQAALCPCGCGHMARDTTSEDTEWVAGDPVRCYARHALVVAQKVERVHPEALLWTAYRRR